MRIKINKSWKMKWQRFKAEWSKERQQLSFAMQLIKELATDLLSELKPFVKYLTMVVLIGLLLMLLGGCSAKQQAIAPSQTFLNKINCDIDVTTYRSMAESLKRCEKVNDQHNTDKQSIRLEFEGVE